MLKNSSGEPLLGPKTIWTGADVDGDGLDDLLIVAPDGAVSAVMNPKVERNRRRVPNHDLLRRLRLRPVPADALCPRQCAGEGEGRTPLLFHEDSNRAMKPLKRFTFTDKEAWKIVQDDVNGTKQNVLSLFKQSNYKPPVRGCRR